MAAVKRQERQRPQRETGDETRGLAVGRARTGGHSEPTSGIRWTAARIAAPLAPA